MKNRHLGCILALVVLAATTGWAYWPVIEGLWGVWKSDDDYSAGQLVPIVALFLVWMERKRLGQCSLKPGWRSGVILLVLAQAARVYGLVFMYESIERYALVPTIMGLVLMVAGWQVFRTLWWIMALVFLMFPLPGRVHNLVSGPLQGMATSGAVFLLEVFGVNVGQQGNVINMSGAASLAVAEACSGLRMLTAFVVVAAFIAYMVRRSAGQKLIVVLSSVPIAVICNIVRIFLTACFMLFVGGEFAQTFFHDFAGFVMMPVAVLLIFGELWLLDRLVASESESTAEEDSEMVIQSRRLRRPPLES